MRYRCRISDGNRALNERIRRLRGINFHWLNGRFGISSAMLVAQGFGPQVKFMFARQFAGLACKEAVGEIFAAIRQHLSNLYRAARVQRSDKGLGTVRRSAPFDLYKQPARGLVDGHKKPASGRLVGQLWQVLDNQVQSL